MPTQTPVPQSAVEFQTLAREESLSDRVTSQIEQMIADNRLPVGKRLPSERELARQFGVSRTVVREAVRALAAKNLLEVQAGSGTVVRSPTVRSVAQSMRMLLRVGQRQLDYEKLHEVRRLLEMEIVALAALRRTDEDLAALDAIMADAEHVRSDRDGFARNDVEFHYALACATHNDLYPLFLDSIADILLTVRQVGFVVNDMPARALHHHQATLEQVRAGSPEGARQAMHAHLLEAEDTMRKALAAEAAGQPSLAGPN